MEELNKAIEEKIKSCGYPRAISGEAVYEDICDQIDGKENGSYVLLSKFEDDAIFEYHITVMDQDFNLGILTMRLPEGDFEVNFDEYRQKEIKIRQFYKDLTTPCKRPLFQV